MKTFEAQVVTDKEITLKRIDQLQELYKTIQDEENFTVHWELDTIKYSQVMITSNIISKVNNGEIKLAAMEKEKKK